MSFKRSLLILCAVSVAIGIVIISIGFVLFPGRIKGAYAVLIVSEAVPDGEIRRLLGDSIISESSQWVFLDDFDGLKQIPLDEYQSRLLPFDPRNDGYADKLHSFFVRNGKRFSFIPLDSSLTGGLEKRISKLLGEIPFSLEYLGYKTPLGILIAIFILAAVIQLFLHLLPFHPRIETVDLIFCLPVLAFFVFFGTAGFILAALLIAIAALLREPLLELFFFLRYLERGALYPQRGQRPKFPEYKGKSIKNRFKRDIFMPFRFNWLLASGFFAVYTFVVFYTKILILLSMGVFFLFAVIFGFSLRVFSLRGDSQGHIRFLPVSIRKKPVNPVFFTVMLPFIFAAAAAQLFSSTMPVSSESAALVSLQGELVTEEQYLAHAAFQSSFSLRPLNRENENLYPEGNLGPDRPRWEMPEFSQADDGLVDPVQADSVLPSEADMPQFPLKKLMDFLTSMRGDKITKKVLSY